MRRTVGGQNSRADWTWDRDRAVWNWGIAAEKARIVDTAADAPDWDRYRRGESRKHVQGIAAQLHVDHVGKRHLVVGSRLLLNKLIQRGQLVVGKRAVGKGDIAAVESRQAIRSTDHDPAVILHAALRQDVIDRAIELIPRGIVENAEAAVDPHGRLG